MTQDEPNKILADHKLWTEGEGGKEHGQYYDTLMFSCASEKDAIDAIELLVELQEGY